jgi:hypothetical protein
MSAASPRVLISSARGDRGGQLLGPPGKNDLVARGFDAKDAHEAAKANPAARRARAIVDLDRAT